MNMMSKSGIFRKWAGGMSLSFLFFSTGLAPVYASDTEVYARSVSVTSGSISPVLMMVLDSSGSMNFCMDGTNFCEYPNPRRTEVLRAAMKKVLFGNHDTANGAAIVKPTPHYIKMGYARFNPNANDGGWMRYPARQLGDFVPYADTEWSSEPVIFETRVLGSEDDAAGASISGTSYQVGSDEIALRFADLQIPRGATVTGATLTFFHPKHPGTIPTNVLVSREDTTNAQPFTALTLPLLRTYTASSSRATKVPVQTGLSGTYVNGIVSIDVTSEVNAQVGAGWCGGNAMSLKISPDSSSSGSFTALSWDGVDADTRTRAASSLPTTDARPRLVVTYTISRAADTCITAPIHSIVGIQDTLSDVEWTDATTSLVDYSADELRPAVVSATGVATHVGLHFPRAKILDGATIKGAWLYVTAKTAAAAATNVAIRAYASSNLPAFCVKETAPARIVCTKPTAPLMSTVPAAILPLPTTVSGEGSHLAVDVTDQVAAVVGASGWSEDSNIGFDMTAAGTTGSLAELYSMGTGLSKAAVLHVYMTKRFDNMAAYKKTIRQDLYDDISVRMYAEGGTPLGDAYAEAARYMMSLPTLKEDSFTSTLGGLTPSIGYDQPDARASVEGTYVVPSGSGTRTVAGKIYQSPIVIGQCSANYLYMMSDGEPSNVSNVVNNSNGVTGTFSSGCDAYAADSNTQSVAANNFDCMMAVANHLAVGNNQLATTVRTNTVFFDDRIDPDTGLPKAEVAAIAHDMAEVARHGGGSFFMANNEEALLESMSKTLTALLDETGSITAPGVAVNQFNRLTHLDQLYYAVFDPETGKAHWRGNVKRYRLEFYTDTNGKPAARIVDKDGRPAIQTRTDDTFFSPDSWSFWSPQKDGSTAVLGGVASVLPLPDSRNIYTYLGAYSASQMTPVLLRDVIVTTGRSAVTGLTDDRQFTNLRNWLNGYDIDIVNAAGDAISTANINVNPSSTPKRKELGGVLHSQPVLVNYGYVNTNLPDTQDALNAQTNADLQENMVYFSTMDGMLHGANARTGIETFAFMPKETLAKSARLPINPVQSLPEFGLDLTWTVHRVDGNADLKIEGDGGSADPDKLWLYGGMRMGGSNYYALNVTNRAASPKLKWVINGGTGGTGGSADATNHYASMGQSWSKPVLGQVKINGVITNVLFFGGGYDDKHETEGFDATRNASDAKGNQLYIVNADTGAFIWQASNAGASLNVADMKFSIVAEPKLFDANKDGLVDAVYFGDLGGQLFRLDINNANTAASGLGARVRRLANIGQLETTASGIVANQRRFYETPSVAMMYDTATSTPYVSVAIGSGYRSHPLDTDTEDAFYVFRDKDVLLPDLATVSDTSLQATITSSAMAQLDLSSPAGATIATTDMGWWVDFTRNGEKVLASALTLFGEVFFTTYQPLVNTDDPCSPLIGATYLWRMSVTDGAATFDFNKDGNITASDRNESSVLGLGGAPQLVIGEDGKNAIITGTGVQRNKDLQTPTMRRTRWFEKTK